MAPTVQARSRQGPSQAPNAGLARTTPTTKRQVPTTNAYTNPAMQQDIEQRQSFELVQTLMLVSLTSLCYLRNLLPVECFEERDYDSIRKDAHWAYGDFLRNHIPSQDLITSSHNQFDELQNSKNTRRFRIISRGGSAAADKLHLWLDGISDALKRHFLASVQLSIILDKNRPSEVIESYNFTVGYKESRLSGLVFSSGTQRPVTIKSAKHGLNMIIRYLIELVQTLPDLPETRFLTIHLFYRDNCPAAYNPPGFRANLDSTILVADSDLWKMNKVNLGQMDTKYHQINLNAAFLTAAHDPEDMSDDDVPIPSDLKFTREISRLSELSPCSVLKESKEDERFVHILDLVDRAPTIAETSSRKIDPDVFPQASHVLSPGIEELGDSQALTRRRLKSMLNSNPPKENLTQTQLVQTDESQLFKNGSWELTRAKSAKLWPKREMYLKDKSIVNRKYTIQCACGSTEVEGNTVRCDCCSTLQHQHCYGLDGEPLGKAHVCYTCLLEDCAESLLPKMQEIARKRRTCWIVKHGHNGVVPSDAEFGKLIGLPTKQFSLMLTKLTREGVIRSNRDSRKAGFKASGAPRLIFCEDRARANYQELGFLHPLASIQRYYEKHKENNNNNNNNNNNEEMSSTECETEESVNLDSTMDLGRFEQDAEVPVTPQKRLRDAGIAESTATNKRIGEEESCNARKRLRSSKAMSPLNVSDHHDRAR